MVRSSRVRVQPGFLDSFCSRSYRENLSVCRDALLPHAYKMKHDSVTQQSLVAVRDEQH